MRTDLYTIEFLKPNLKNVGGGGIGTLNLHLLPVLLEIGHPVTIYQCADESFETDFMGARVTGIPLRPGPGWPNERVVQRFRDYAAARAGGGPRIELFMADFFSVRNDNPLAICVQNGLAWDAAIELITSRRINQNGWGEWLFRMRAQRRGLRRFETCFNRVAVDLYFVNWYRSFRGPNLKGRVFYNPNPAPPALWDERRDRVLPGGAPVKLVMARRLVPEKGTRLAAAVLRELLRRRSAIEVTFAGDGPDKTYLERVFAGEPRVSFASYQPAGALAFHAGFDIALIPSVCGEATCLAVNEAMAAGCAVVATNMGGTITQVIDRFNGRLCWPEEDELLQALTDLVDDAQLRLRLQRRGWETTQEAFGHRAWSDRWSSILGHVVEGREEAERAIRAGLRPGAVG